MEYLREINDRYAVSLSHPDIDDFERLLDSGYGAVVNLREPEEPGQALTPDRERGVATKLGMLYSHIPIAAESLDEDTVDNFRETVSGLPGKVLIHSGTGHRSVALAVIHIALEEGCSGEQALEMVKKLNLEWDTGDLNRFIQNYVDSHGSGPH